MTDRQRRARSGQLPIGHPVRQPTESQRGQADRVTQTGPELSLVWTGLLFAQCRRVSQCWDVERA